MNAETHEDAEKNWDAVTIRSIKKPTLTSSKPMPLPLI